MSKYSDDKFSNDEFGVESPAWADGKIINEAIFCEEFLSKHKIIFSGGSFFTAEGRVVDELFHGRYPSGSSNRIYCKTYRKVSIRKSRTPKGMRRYIKIISNYIQNSILSKKIEYSQVKSLMNTQYGAGNRT